MLPSTQSSRVIGGVETEVVIQSYADRVLVLVTQLGKIGNLIQASVPQTIPLPPTPPLDITSENLILNEPLSSIELVTLLGGAQNLEMDNLHKLYTSQIATLIWTHGLPEDRRNVVVGIALRKDKGNRERVTFLEVMRMVLELLRTST